MAVTQSQSDSITAAVLDVAAAPNEIQNAAGERVKENSIPDLIAGAQFSATAAARAASSSPLAGMRIGKAGFGPTTGNG